MVMVVRCGRGRGHLGGVGHGCYVLAGKTRIANDDAGCHLRCGETLVVLTSRAGGNWQGRGGSRWLGGPKHM